jgi:holo-[acyl-carrier protein] synthase
MIYGIGTDIAAVARLRGMWERHGEGQLENCWHRPKWPILPRPAEKGRFLAKRFAAKEAFAKALGTGVRPPATLTGHCRRPRRSGQAGHVECYGQLEKMVIKNLKTHLSISDEADYAVAYVILEQA